MPQTVEMQSLMAVRGVEPPPGLEACGAAEWFEVWPHENITSRLPVDFCLRFVVTATEGDVRRVLPVGGPDRFLIECGLLGQVLLEASRQWGPQEVLLSNLHRMVFQQRANLQERRHRTFNHRMDLLIPRRVRDTPEESDLLPHDLQSSEPRSGFARLLDDGATEARELGLTEPDFETRLLKGLLAAARRSPIELNEMTSDERRGLVRFLLFDAGRESGETDFGRLIVEHKETATERLLDALVDHLDDDTDAFRNFFLEKTSDLIRRISKQRREGGPIPRVVVREIRLQILVDAVKSIARCIWTVMRAIVTRLPETMSERDLEFYRRLYRPQTELDSISLAVLADWLKPLQLNPYTAPAEPLAQSAIVLQVVRYYSEMVDRARAADRQSKAAQKDSPAQLSETAGKLTPDDANEKTARRAADAGLTEIDIELATRIADCNRFDCRCDCKERRGFIHRCAEGVGEFELEIVCSRCQSCRTYHCDSQDDNLIREVPQEDR